MASEAFKVRRNIFGRFWKYLEIVGNPWKSLGRFRKSKTKISGV